MKTKFTPGPWKFNITKTALLAFDNKNEHLFIYNASPYRSIEPKKADAALIEAAPEMYEAIEKLMLAIEKCEQYVKIDNEIENAIFLAKQILKKARGE